VILAVRSESVIVPAGETKFKSVVLERYSIGKDQLSLLNVEGQQMRAYISGDYPIRIGDPLDFSLKNRGVFLFDAQSGERLA
jgi:ABC-type sugar transport system ATPase subunit